MTGGECGGYSSIRVRLAGGAAGNVDVHALRKWLERERGLEILVDDEELSIYEQPRADGGDAVGNGPIMGVAMDIVLVMTGAVAPKVFDLVLARTRSGVEAWRSNRRSVEPGDPPEVEIRPIDPSEGGPDTGDSGEE